MQIIIMETIFYKFLLNKIQQFNVYMLK